MEIKVPEVGESVYEARIGKWHKNDGESVRRDDLLCEVETDKITLELHAEEEGVLSISVPEGTTVKIGTVIGTIKPGEAGVTAKEEKKAAPAREHLVPPSSRRVPKEKEPHPEEIAAPSEVTQPADLFSYAQSEQERQKEMAEKPAEPKTREFPKVAEPSAAGPAPETREGERVTRAPMSPIRKRIAERLLAARQQTAMLTTFNEVDMGRVMELRRRHSEHLEKKYGVKLGFMSFFVKAVVEALRQFPVVNARIEGDDIVWQHFYEIGIAVAGEKGLVVPVLKDAHRLSFAEIEKQIGEFVEKVRSNRLAISDLEGGTFTITNGGIFGSLMSTPIINPPQSAVLGMHAVQDRPVVRDGQVIVRPMMYLALSYDHRIIDGREAVLFLKRIKELIEEPEEIFLEA